MPGLLALGCAAPSSLETGASLVDASLESHGVWRRDLGRAVEFAPAAVADGFLVASTEGTLWRMSPETSGEKWKQKLPASPAAAPVVCGEVAAVATDSPAGNVVGVRLSDGKEMWKWGRALSLPAAADGALVLALRRGEAVRLDPATGEEVWRVPLPGAGWRAPLVLAADNLAVFPVRRDSVVALSLDGGERRWSRRVGDWPRLSAGAGRLFAATDDSLLVTLEPRTGDVGTTHRLSAIAAGLVATDDGIAVMALRNGEVAALTLPELDVLWQHRLEPPLRAAPHVADGRVWMASPRGTVVTFALDDGRELHRYHHPELLVAAPVSGEEWVAVAGDKGTVTVYRREF